MNRKELERNRWCIIPAFFWPQTFWMDSQCSGEDSNEALPGCNFVRQFDLLPSQPPEEMCAFSQDVSLYITSGPQSKWRKCHSRPKFRASAILLLLLQDMKQFVKISQLVQNLKYGDTQAQPVRRSRRPTTSPPSPSPFKEVNMVNRHFCKLLLESVLRTLSLP
jgi:hypothetical protein